MKAKQAFLSSPHWGAILSSFTCLPQTSLSSSPMVVLHHHPSPCWCYTTTLLHAGAPPLSFAQASSHSLLRCQISFHSKCIMSMSSPLRRSGRLQVLACGFYGSQVKDHFQGWFLIIKTPAKFKSDWWAHINSCRLDTAYCFVIQLL